MITSLSIWLTSTDSLSRCLTWGRNDLRSLKLWMKMILRWTSTQHLLIGMKNRRGKALTGSWSTRLKRWESATKAHSMRFSPRWKNWPCSLLMNVISFCAKHRMIRPSLRNWRIIQKHCAESLPLRRFSLTKCSSRPRLPSSAQEPYSSLTRILWISFRIRCQNKVRWRRGFN